MALLPLNIPGGVRRNGTKYQSKGFWYDTNLVRFFEDGIKPIGGWAPLTEDEVGPIVLSGIPRGALGWEVGGGRSWQAYGTSSATEGNTRVYAYSLGTLYDVTPFTFTELWNEDFVAADTTTLITLGYSTNLCRTTANRAYHTDANGVHQAYPYTIAQHVSYGDGKTFDVYIDAYREQVALSGQGCGLSFWATGNGTSNWCAVFIQYLSATEVSIKIERRTAPSTFWDLETLATITLAAGAGIMIGVRIDQDNAVITPFIADAGTGANRIDYGVWTHTDGTWHSDGAHLNTGVFFMGAGSYSYDRVYLDNHIVEEVVSGLAVSNEDTDLSSGSAGFYGSGFYNTGVYGVGQAFGIIEEADMWHLENFGNVLLACQVPTNDSIYVWNPATPTVPMALITASAGTVPVGNRGIVVTPERFVVALGADGNVRDVKWCDQEDYTDWLATATNQAGLYTLEGRGKLMAGRKGRGETLLWTDADLWTMTYIGGILVYGFERKGANCGLVGPNAIGEYNGAHVWMSNRGFHTFDGYVRNLPCELEDYLFSDINRVQRVKITAHTNHEFDEIWWYYPSGNSDEIDSYVMWNYEEDTWCMGKLARTCAISATTTNNKPILLDPSGNVYQHETGWDHTPNQPVGFQTPYAESGPIEIQSGEQFVDVTGIFPDEKNLGEVQYRLYSGNYPTETEVEFGPFTSVNPTDVRLNGRQVRLRIEEVVVDDWRVGVLRLDGTLGERR